MIAINVQISQQGLLIVVAQSFIVDKLRVSLNFLKVQKIRYIDDKKGHNTKTNKHNENSFTSARNDHCLRGL